MFNNGIGPAEYDPVSPQPCDWRVGSRHGMKRQGPLDFETGCERPIRGTEPANWYRDGRTTSLSRRLVPLMMR
jgi:hypothetical protein